MSILNERERVLNQVCPYCNAAKGSLCLTKIYNSAGVQQRYTNIFHAERVVTAQTPEERIMDAVINIGRQIKEKPLK